MALMPDRPETRSGSRAAHLLRLWLYCLAQFVRLSLFLSSPARLPWNPALLAMTLAAYLLAGWLILGSLRPLGDILIQIGIEIGLLALITRLLLAIQQHPERFVQTLHALIGVNLVVSLVSYPLMAWLPQPLRDGQPDMTALQLSLLLLLWNLAAISLIFRRAFGIGTLLAGFLAFSYFLVFEWLLMKVFA
jgi:hypothetical protein